MCAPSEARNESGKLRLMSPNLAAPLWTIFYHSNMSLLCRAERKKIYRRLTHRPVINLCLNLQVPMMCRQIVIWTRTSQRISFKCTSFDSCDPLLFDFFWVQLDSVKTSVAKHQISAGRREMALTLKLKFRSFAAERLTWSLRTQKRVDRAVRELFNGIHFTAIQSTCTPVLKQLNSPFCLSH